MIDDKQSEERARERSTLTRELEGEGGDGRGMGLALATLQTKHTITQGGSRVERERVPCVVHTPELMRMPGNTNVTPPGAVLIEGEEMAAAWDSR